MVWGRRIGREWSTVKEPRLGGVRMVFVQPRSPELQPTGRRIICTDWTGAGTGELVYWVRGKEAAMPFSPAEPPTDATIVGIVDSVHLAAKPSDPAPAPQANETRRAPVRSSHSKASREVLARKPKC